MCVCGLKNIKIKKIYRNIFFFKKIINWRGIYENLQNPKKSYKILKNYTFKVVLKYKLYTKINL